MRDAAAESRWRGQPGRLEVWYATATDSATGTGLWLHHERVAPVSESGRAPYAHGWAAVFAPGGAPVLQRFGPESVSSDVPEDRPGTWLVGGSTVAGPEGFEGAAGGLAWDLRVAGDQSPMWTMPRRVWEHELLPAAQVVVAPRARFRGSVCQPSGEIQFDGIGNVAHIYGHGNAHRWAWLHADLDDATTLEIVAAVGRRPAMRWLPPLSFVQLRRAGHDDWPRNPLAAAPLFRARLGLPDWRVRGLVGDRRLTVDVSQPADRCVSLDYTDPDGAHAICTNSEIADVDVRLERLAGVGRGWQVEGEWTLRGTAHAERGYRD